MDEEILDAEVVAEGLPIETEALFLAALDAHIKANKAAARAPFAGRYSNGDKATFRSPLDDAKLGTVYREDPDPEWQVVDPAALREHLHAAGHVETVHEIAGDDAEVIAVLLEHAPHLLAEITRVPQSAITAAVAESKAAGEPTAPGIKKVAPQGRLVVRADKHAGEAFGRLIRAQRLAWDGRPLELPAAEPAA